MVLAVTYTLIRRWLSGAWTTSLRVTGTVRVSARHQLPMVNFKSFKCPLVCGSRTFFAA